jgi:hypothetical protein
MMQSIEIQTAMTPPKVRPPHSSKPHALHVRLNAAELDLLARASEAAGAATSTWARIVLVAEARKVLRSAQQ